ncbi:MAG: hypothetical protein EZS28_053283, partial [Streblomastix strix]
VAFVLVVSLQRYSKKTSNVLIICLISVGLSFLVGILKEIVDIMLKQGFSWWNVVSDLGGCALAMGIMITGIAIRLLLIRDAKMKQFPDGCIEEISNIRFNNEKFKENGSKPSKNIKLQDLELSD